MNNKKYPSMMRWSDKDWVNLRKAVNSFNRKIDMLRKMGYENLPPKESYRELVGIEELNNKTMSREIMTRKEYNYKLASLKRFTEGTAKTVTLPSGQNITAWEKGEITRLKRKATMALEKEIKDLYNQGASKDWIKSRMLTLESLDDVYKLKGADLRRKIRVLENNARGDRELRYAKQWQINFLGAVEDLEGYEGSDKLLEKLKSIKNPLELYDYVSKSEILSDLFLFYKDSATAQTFGGFSSNQEAFDYAMNELGL